MTAPTPEVPPPRKVVRVTRAHVYAARGRIIVDHKLGETTPGWVFKVAAADGDPAWRTGGAELARVARMPLARRTGEPRKPWWRRLIEARQLAR